MVPEHLRHWLRTISRLGSYGRILAYSGAWPTVASSRDKKGAGLIGLLERTERAVETGQYTFCVAPMMDWIISAYGERT